MGDRLVELMGFDPHSTVEKREELIRRILEELVKQTRRPTALSNGIHLDCSKLVRGGKLTAKDGARLHVTLASGRY